MQRLQRIRRGRCESKLTRLLPVCWVDQEFALKRGAEFAKCTSLMNCGVDPRCWDNWSVITALYTKTLKTCTGKDLRIEWGLYGYKGWKSGLEGPEMVWSKEWIDTKLTVDCLYFCMILFILEYVNFLYKNKLLLKWISASGLNLNLELRPRDIVGGSIYSFLSLLPIQLASKA